MNELYGCGLYELRSPIKPLRLLWRMCVLPLWS